MSQPTQITSLKIPRKVVTGATTLMAKDSGKCIVMRAAAGATITLPANVNGLSFRFVVGSAFATSNWVVAAATADADTLEGSLVVNGAAVTVNAADQVNFVNSAENIGDVVDIWGDGTYWYVSGTGLSAGSITATG